MTAYAYLRKSSVRDPEREVSHEVQERAVRELADRHGDNHGTLTILSDWDKSGRLGADKRPGYAALIEAIESGRCTAVYSYSLSRLGRSVAELARLIADCERRGIPVRIAVDAVDTSTASGRLLTHVLASVAAFEADVASERVRAANAAKVARGESLATTPSYGQREGEDAQAVLDAFAEGGSYTRAARILNEKGLKPRNGRAWWPSSVSVIVKRLDPSVRTQRPSRGYKAGGSDFILARLLRCPTCNTRLTGSRDRGGRVRYSCRLGGSIPHSRISISEHFILDAVKDEVAHLVTPADVEALEDNTQRLSLEARRARIADMYESGVIDRQDRDRRMEAILRGLERLDSRRLVSAVPEIDWTWGPKELNRVLRAIFTEIVLNADFQPITFQWRVSEWRG